MSSFYPHPNDTIEISGFQYQFSEHPNAPNTTYSQEGRKATVYQLIRGCKQKFALKVFKVSFRNSDIDKKSTAFLSLARRPGLQVCEYECITNSNNQNLIAQYPELEYAVLMPWIEGETWFDIIYPKKQKIINFEYCVKLALHLVDMLSNFESNQLAHCDISSANVIIQYDENNIPKGIQLIDIDDFYSPSFTRPSTIPMGTAGYGHPSIKDEGVWGPIADRFSGAILLAEILCWHDQGVRALVSGESYFDECDLRQPGNQKYKVLYNALESFGKELADLFEIAWTAKTLADCPTFKQWDETQVIIKMRLASALNAKDDIQVVAQAAKFKAKNYIMTREEWFACSMAARRIRAQNNMKAAINQGNDIAILAAYDPVALSMDDISSIQKTSIQLARQRLEGYLPLRRAIDEDNFQSIPALYDESLFANTDYLNLSDQAKIQLAMQSQPVRPDSTIVITDRDTPHLSIASSLFITSKTSPGDLTDPELIDLWIKGDVSEKTLVNEQDRQRLRDLIINYGALLRLRIAVAKKNIHAIQRIYNSPAIQNHQPLHLDLEQQVIELLKLSDSQSVSQ